MASAPRFPQTVIDLHGDAGARWLEQLPDLLSRCEQRWSITVEPPFPNLSYNYVAPATAADGAPLVLKANLPSSGSLRREIAALQWYGGSGCMRLVAADIDAGVLLIERLLPGTPLYELHDDERMTAILADVMCALWRELPPEHPFPTADYLASGLSRLRTTFDGGVGPFPPLLVDAAERLFAELLSSSAPAVLLHGDLHHWNVLDGGGRWLAIDPEPVAAEPAYELGALLRNPITDMLGMKDLRAVQARRVTQLSERLGLPAERIAAWGVAQGVLSAWWDYEDHGSPGQPALAAAEALLPLVR